MKKTIYALSCSFLILLSSCSKNDSNIVPSTSTSAESSANISTSGSIKGVNISGEIVGRSVITPQTPLPFMSSYDLAKNRNARILTWTEFGPFTTSAGTLTQIETNKQMVLTGFSNYPTGTYFCNVWICQQKVTLPSSALMDFQGASKTGFANYSTLAQGINVVQSILGNGTTEHTFYTYSIVPMYNAAGQFIYNGTLPVDLTGTTFTYKYLQNI
ncbi:hypothetical protein GCM10028803_53120 [Larkinella knui]|uniref:Lipoprotein n=1 Tax=Larkinella knui TaxID=2025310 RepID=A0A3P1CGM2_9BACT|nr:hypothetical protein [Larkinella knui]RRB12482.1 hypothetical protein EHT87_19985 [Larkinella knui]